MEEKKNKLFIEAKKLWKKKKTKNFKILIFEQKNKNKDLEIEDYATNELDD